MNIPFDLPDGRLVIATVGSDDHRLQINVGHRMHLVEAVAECKRLAFSMIMTSRLLNDDHLLTVMSPVRSLFGGRTLYEVPTYGWIGNFTNETGEQYLVHAGPIKGDVSGAESVVVTMSKASMPEHTWPLEHCLQVDQRLALTVLEALKLQVSFYSAKLEPVAA